MFPGSMIVCLRWFILTHQRKAILLLHAMRIPNQRFRSIAARLQKLDFLSPYTFPLFCNFIFSVLHLYIHTSDKYSIKGHESSCFSFDSINRLFCIFPDPPGMPLRAPLPCPKPAPHSPCSALLSWIPGTVPDVCITRPLLILFLSSA